MSIEFDDRKNEQLATVNREWRVLGDLTERQALMCNVQNKFIQSLTHNLTPEEYVAKANNFSQEFNGRASDGVTINEFLRFTKTICCEMYGQEYKNSVAQTLKISTTTRT